MTLRPAENDRQRTMINRLLDGFAGKLTSSKWAALTTTSQDTAWRDIDNLIGRRTLVKEPGGGRSTNYALAKVNVPWVVSGASLLTGRLDGADKRAVACRAQPTRSA